MIDQAAINESVSKRDFKYYIFDWDDNVLKMPTKIFLEKLQPDGSWKRQAVSTATFALVRTDTVNYRAPDGDWENAFVDFRDYKTEGESRFISDTRTAIYKVLSGEEAPCPSFETLRRTLREGRLFAIVTARGHNPDSLRAGVRMFIDCVLTNAEYEEMIASLRAYRAVYDGVEDAGSDEEVINYYLSLNRYHAVTNPVFARWMRSHTGADNPGSGKKFAIRDFIEHVIRIMRKNHADFSRPISVGFSDDDQGNVEIVSNYIHEELSKQFPSIKFCVYDTSDPDLRDGKKVTISGQLDLGLYRL